MKSIVNFINESNSDLYNPITSEDIKKSINKLDPSEWAKINTSKITDMSFLFNGYRGKFGDISKWDVSNVKNMQGMFAYSLFNGDISNWDVSNVENMEEMFANSPFNKDISKWDVHNVKNMKAMFTYSNFDQDISKWDVSNVKNMDNMFRGSQFSKDLSKWDISSVESFSDMFTGCPLDVSKSKKLPKWYENDFSWLK